MSRLIGPTGSRRRRRFLLLPVLLAATLALFFVAGAQAVHDLQFQLDGDVLASTTTNVGGTTQPLDWNSFFDASGNKLALPTNFSASGFDKDFGNTGTTFSTADTTTYATGSKDTLPISPGWQCNFDNNVNSKIDIMNAYAAAYTNPANGHEIIYFALERNSNAGDGNVAFWFLQGNVGCSTTGSNAPFTGSHTDGDILVVSAFTNGGAVSAVDAYRWNGGANGSLGTTPVAHGVDCKSQSGGPGDTTCATVNGPTNGTGGTITTPWLTSNKVDGVGHSLRTSEFFEGGLDLTASNLGGRCFNTFIGDTRSSQSLTATLFDFARGVLGECSVSMTTTPSTTTTSLGDNTAVTDSADVVGSTSAGAAGPTPTGTVTFFLCSPAQVTNGGCEGTNGTQVGSPVTLTEKVPGTGTATSANARSLITGIGTWCFRAHYIAAPNDANYPGQTADETNATGECFTVTDVASTSTAQSWLPQDTATITTTGGSAVAGTVTFSLYESANCSGNPVQTFPDRPVSASPPYTASTNNTTYYTTNKTISWRAVFTSSNSVGSGPAGHCETSSIANLNNDTGS